MPGRARCREDLHARRGRRRASPRSAHTASLRTPQKSKPSSGSRFVSSIQREQKCSSAIRCHHLVKTFRGWHDLQLPDGTVILNSPSGKTYVTTPGSAVLFPSLCLPTVYVASELHRPVDYCGERIAMMARRRRTRRQERTHRIGAERRRNQQAHTVRRCESMSFVGRAHLTPTTIRRRSRPGASTGYHHEQD